MHALNVLIVEDNAIQSKIVENRLRQCGVLNIDTAIDGKEALTALHKSKYDLLLIDILMDGMDGIALINELYYNDIKIPFYITSSVSKESLGFINEMAKKFELPILGILPKPINLDVLQPILQKLLPETKKQSKKVLNKMSASHVLSMIDANDVIPQYSVVSNIKERTLESISISYQFKSSGKSFCWSDIAYQETPTDAQEKAQSKLFECLIKLAIEPICDNFKLKKVPKLTFNVSTVQLNISSFFENINRFFQQQYVDSDNIVLEVSESELDVDYKAILPGITRARIHHYTVAIGRIKKGYQSLLMIRELPISEIRLDQSLIDNCHRIMANRVLISSLIRMAKIESVKSTAVGVKCPDELASLRSLSCDSYESQELSLV